MTSNPLSVYANDETSQDGENGIIARIFEIIGTKNKWCLEVGASDGESANVRPLIEAGWNALMIEAVPQYYRKLAALYAGNPRVHTRNTFLEFEGAASLDALSKAAGMPRDYDLLVLDVDGNDYHLWDSMREYAPRVVCIEFNQSIPNSVAFIQPRDMRVNQGSSLRSIAALGEKKGYALVGTTGWNAFFVRQEYFIKFGITDASLDALHPDTRFQTQLYQLYDGTLRIAGNDRLLWHKRPIDLEALQVLPKYARKYPAHIDESEAMRRLKDWIRRSPFYGIIRALRS